MLSFVHSILDSYATDAILSVFISFVLCCVASKYFSRPTMRMGLARAGPKFKQIATKKVDSCRTYESMRNSTPPSSPEPESEPVDGVAAKPDGLHSNSCLLRPSQVQNSNPEPEESVSSPAAIYREPSLAVTMHENSHSIHKPSGMHREISPPKVFRWSYDAHIEDQKQIQRRGTYSPLAESLRPEFKLPPGLDHPGLPGWNEISYNFAGLRLAAPAIGNSIDKSNAKGSGSLRENMELLKKHDPGCVLVVKKIKQLGFQSPTILKKHFEQYGVVLDVLVALTHSPQKSHSSRVRPAAMGYVVMGDAAGANRALQAGFSQDVSGVVIEMRSFSSFTDHYGKD